MCRLARRSVTFGRGVNYQSPDLGDRVFEMLLKAQVNKDGLIIVKLRV